MSAIARVADHSPTAQLLRHSRLFSVPQPLPRPDLSRSHGTDKRVESRTATTPYPIYQAIGTTNIAKQRGDWGLKRSLPLESTSTKRAITMQTLDTNDEITEFESGHAHVMTLRKLQEMNLPLSRFLIGSTSDGRDSRSAFDADVDNTAPSPQSLRQSLLERSKSTRETQQLLPHRWKRRGPDLRNVPEANFQKYLTSLLDKEPHFLQFLEAYYVQSDGILQWQDDQSGAIEDQPEKIKGLTAQIKPLHLRFLQSLSLEELQSYLNPVGPVKNIAPWIKVSPFVPKFDAVEEHIRIEDAITAEKTLETHDAPSEVHSSSTETAVGEKAQGVGLDLNGTPDLVEEAQEIIERRFRECIAAGFTKYLARFRKSVGKDDEFRHLIEYYLDIPTAIPKDGAQRPELSTHPAAGLSYRRADGNLRNHPVFGPLRHREPYPARLMPSGPVGGTTAEYGSTNHTGVAGLIVKAPGRHAGVPWVADMTIARVRKSYNEDTGEASVPERGTSKGWVIPSQVIVNAQGRLQMNVEKLPDPGELVVEDELKNAIDRDKEIELKGDTPLKSKAPLQYQRLVPARSLDENIVKDGRLAINLDEGSDANLI